jgi:hypothetical protein
MALRIWRFFGLATSVVTFLICAGATAYAAWSHHTTSVKSTNAPPPIPIDRGGTTTTTTAVIPNGFTGTIVLGRLSPIHAYLAAGTDGALGFGTPTFVVMTVSPPKSSTTTTTVSANQNGSTTTTNTTVTAATSPKVTTTTLANPPPTTIQSSISVDIPGFGPTTVSTPIVTLSPQAPANGVTATNLKVTGTITGPVAAAISPGSSTVPFSFTETFQTVAVAPVAPTTTSSSTTMLAEIPILPRGVFEAPTQPEQAAADDIAADVRAASETAQSAIAVCGITKKECVADALDSYADALEQLAPRLPPRLRMLPAIIRKVAHNVRTAKTLAAAARAVKQAIVEVHKTISLLKADDAITRAAGSREGALVIETLQVASDKLERSVGL